MKYAMFSWFGYYMPFEARIDTIAQAGFDEVMLSLESEEAPYLYDKENFCSYVRKSGLDITNFHAPFIGYSQIWERSLKENAGLYQSFAEMLDMCKRHNVPALVVHTCDIELGDYKKQNGLNFFKALTEVAENNEVYLAVENVSRQFLLRYLLDNIQSPYFAMCYDSSHDYMLDEGKGRIIQDYPQRVRALHLSDNDFQKDRHWIPGEGQIPFETVLQNISRTPMEVLSFEVLANEDWREKTPLEFCKQVRQSLDPYQKI